MTRGSILAYRIYDAGDTIALDAAERILESSRRLVLGGPLVEGLVIAVRPLEISLPRAEIVVPKLARTIKADVTAHLYDFGVVSVLY